MDKNRTSTSAYPVEGYALHIEVATYWPVSSKNPVTFLGVPLVSLAVVTAES